MTTIKLSLFGLFLIVLAALIVSMLVGNWFQTTEYHKEGMISYYNGKEPLTEVYMEYYSGPKDEKKYGNNVVLIYDNIFFDQDNANLIEVDSTALNGNVIIGNVVTGKPETNGSSIQKIHIMNAINSDANFNPTQFNTYSYNDDTLVNTKPTTESKKAFKKSYTEMAYTSISGNTDTYTIFVLPWDNHTYVHVINNKSKKNVNTIWFGRGNSNKIQKYESKDKLPFTNNGLYVKDLKEDPMINTYFIKDNSNILIYQLSDCIFFNNNTGVLIIYNDKKYDKFTAYNQYGKEITKDEVKTQKRNELPTINAWTNIYDKYGNIMVLFINNGTKIMIALIQPSEYENKNVYKLFNVQRFNFDGLDSGPSYGRTGASKFSGLSSGDENNLAALIGYGYKKTDGWVLIGITSSGDNNWGDDDLGDDDLGDDYWEKKKKSALEGGSPSMMNDYYKWFYHWATNGLNNNPNSKDFKYSDDFIMKTQIVPPVCPSCPSCPSIGTCTNCGGNGGSGTKDMDGSSLANGDDLNRNLNITGGGITVTDAANTIGGVLNNTVSQPANIVAGVENTLEKGASGAVNLARDTGSGAVGLAKDTASGAINEINLIGSSAVGVGKDIVSGTINLGKDIVGGITNLGQGQGVGQGQGQGQGVGSNQYGSGSGGSAANQLLPKNTSSVVDQSNMYGAMPNKGNSNYMPLGSDFSKFGR